MVERRVHPLRRMLDEDCRRLQLTALDDVDAVASAAKQLGRNARLVGVPVQRMVVRLKRCVRQAGVRMSAYEHFALRERTLRWALDGYYEPR